MLFTSIIGPPHQQTSVHNQQTSLLMLAKLVQENLLSWEWWDEPYDTALQTQERFWNDSFQHDWKLKHFNIGSISDIYII